MDKLGRGRGGGGSVPGRKFIGHPTVRCCRSLVKPPWIVCHNYKFKSQGQLEHCGLLGSLICIPCITLDDYSQLNYKLGCSQENIPGLMWSLQTILHLKRHKNCLFGYHLSNPGSLFGYHRYYDVLGFELQFVFLFRAQFQYLQRQIRKGRSQPSSAICSLVNISRPVDNNFQQSYQAPCSLWSGAAILISPYCLSLFGALTLLVEQTRAGWDGLG